MDINVRDARSTGEGAGRWWALGALALAGIITGLDTTVVVTALPTLAVKLGASTGQLQWVMDSYLVVLSGLLLPFGVLGDRFGRKRLLVVGLLLFGVSSVFASLTKSVDALIALRAVMGVGAAPILVLMYSILPSMFSGKERLRAVAVTSASTFVGLSLGPLVGGWLLAHFAWGSIFLINPPVIAIALAGVWFLVPESKDARAPRLDWPGAALSVAGVTALVYGIIEQPMYGWSGARVLAGLIGGVVLLTVFAAQQRRARSPLIDLELFRTPRFSWSTVAIAVVMFALGGVLFTLTPFLQIVQGNDAQATGIRLLPLMAGLMAGAALSDRLTVRLGGKVMVAGGLLVGAVGALLLSRAGADTGFALIAATEVVLGLGLGLAVVTAGDASLGAVPVAETGSGMALVRTAQFIAMSLGVAILGSILNGAYRTGLAVHLAGLPAQARAAASESIAGAHALAPHVFAAARDAYATGMSDVLIVSAVAIAVGAVLVAAFLPSHGSAPQSRLRAPDADVQEADVRQATVHVDGD
jgi:MFS transporter, DHA2 family, multidrug resistance protein